jgi:hypothetical protein
MGHKHDRTLAAIFAEPTRANIRWDDFVALVESRGGLVESRGGSAFRFRLAGARPLSLHRPHPGKEMKKWAVEDARQFLREAGITP